MTQEGIRSRFVAGYARPYIGGMNIRARIQAIMDVKEWNQEELAEELQVTQATVSRWMNGADPRGETRDRINELHSRVVGAPAQPEGPSFGRVIGVIGRIGAGGSIETSSEQINHAEPLFEVRVPFPIPEDALALQVGGDSMFPRYDDGDVIICSRFGENPDGVVGYPAGVQTAEGNRYLKRVLRGSRPGLYHLESYNAPLMPDVHIVSFSSVIAVIPASQVHKITDHNRRSVTRQIKSGKPDRG